MNVKKIKKDFLDNIGEVSSVFDIACGNGNMINKYIESGKLVLGIDKNTELKERKNFRFVKKDIRDYKFEEKFDLVICSLFLHFFMPQGVEYLIKNMQEITNNGGYNFLVCISNKDKLSEKNKTHFYTSLEELSKLYEGWEIVKSVQGETEKEIHDGLEEHTHDIIFVLFKKVD